jgi:pyrroloquinoline-quinone synthase
MSAVLQATPDSKVEQILKRFDAEIQKRKYTNHSWTKFVLSGEAQRHNLKNWAIQKYHQTYLQIPIFSILHSRAQSEGLRKFMVDQLIDEESDLRSGGDSHYGLMRRFAIAMGATPEEVASVPAAPAVTRYVDAIKDICHKEHPAAVLAAMYAGESQTSDVMSRVLVQLKQQFGLSDHDIEWFTVHAGDDVHADAERELMATEGVNVPDLEEAGLRVIDRFMTEWGLLQDYYYAVTVKN